MGMQERWGADIGMEGREGIPVEKNESGAA